MGGGGCYPHLQSTVFPLSVSVSVSPSLHISVSVIKHVCRPVRPLSRVKTFPCLFDEPYPARKENAVGVGVSAVLGITLSPDSETRTS